MKRNEEPHKVEIEIKELIKEFQNHCVTVKQGKEAFIFRYVVYFFRKNKTKQNIELKLTLYAVFIVCLAVVHM